MTTDTSTIAALQQSVADFVRRGTRLKRVRDQRGQLPGYDRQVWCNLADLGWLGVLIPERHGGLGLGLAETAVIAQGLAEAVVPEPFTAACVFATTAIVHGDNPSLQSRLLPQIAAGTLLPAMAWQESAGNADPLQAEMSAAADGDDVVLTGVKRFVAGGMGADGYVISAQSAAGFALYWVPALSAGLASVHELLADGTFAATLRLSNVRLSKHQRIAGDAVAKDAMRRAFDAAAIISGAELLGITSRALDITLDYLRTRRQFGKPIGSFQALQHRAVDMYIQRELASAVLREALDLASSAHDPMANSAVASRAKARCAEAALLVTREAIQMHGAMGYTDDCDVGLYVRRALVLSATAGNANFHRRRFARLSPLQVEERPRRQSAVPNRLGNLPPDTDWNSLADEEFRLLIRGFVEQHYPDELRYLPRRVRWQEVRDWTIRLAQRGWIAPAWPRAWGGMGLSPAKQIIYMDEFERWGVARAPDQGIRQLGPVLMQYGSEAQQRYYLPRILSCEHVWCQGYSEPDAGSDLASLKTSAVLDGDAYVINGRKIWTTLAMDATHIYVLCRTDATAKKQLGISFLIADIATPGITVRPIRDISGNFEFCEVLFENVRTPKDSLVGALNQGWTVAKAMLDFERLGIGSPRRPMIAFNRLARFAARTGLFDDEGFSDRFTKLRIDLADHAALYGRFAEMARRGDRLGPEVSMLKIWGMEMFQRITEFGLEAAGAYGASAGDIELEGDQIDLMAPYYMARLITIGGGSNEIQRNIMAKHVLSLPG